MEKEIQRDEYEIIQHILKHDKDIIPHVYELTLEHVIYSEYSTDYENSLNKHKSEYHSSIKNLVSRLHAIGIVHCDLHSSNIVVNDDDVRLIDFGESYFIEHVDDDVIKNVAKNFGEESINTLEKLLEFDFEAYKT